MIYDILYIIYYILYIIYYILYIIYYILYIRVDALGSSPILNILQQHAEVSDSDGTPVIQTRCYPWWTAKGLHNQCPDSSPTWACRCLMFCVCPPLNTLQHHAEVSASTTHWLFKPVALPGEQQPV
jgi:hypothetical protein